MAAVKAWSVLVAMTLMVVMVTAAPATSNKGDDSSEKVELRMPGVQPQIVDSYLCYGIKAGDEASFLTGFIPHGNMSTAHHMLLYGCLVPGGKDVWNCGEMQRKEKSKPVCKEGSQIVYAWAMDAPALKLPEGVGFKVGGDTSIQYLVLQVHYKDVSLFTPPNNNKDNSGLTLIKTAQEQPKRAGVYLLGTGGTIPAHSTTYMETACSIDDPITLHPFAFRVHTHTHGEVVSGFRIRDGEWKEIGRQSPKLPQMFYNVSDPNMTVEKGDIVAARCTMVDNEDKPVSIGATQKDEMCNFYMMYYVDGSKILNEKYCFRSGPPHWYWQNMKSIHVENAPQDASMVPGTQKILEATAEKMLEKTEEDMKHFSEDMDGTLEELLGSLRGDLLDERGFDPRLLEEEYLDTFPREMRGYNDVLPGGLSEEELQEYYDMLDDGKNVW